tara:strand:+ start:61 stop:798 length:738 start_codon:yes stop_codon:yes gene_type:complete
MPVYNSEKFILESINSVLNQTFRDFELIIIDDLSTDESMHIINSKAVDDHRIKIIRNKKNSGAAISRNNGIKKASGRFITFLDSDDIWEKYFLQSNVDVLSKKDYSFVFSSYKRIKENGENIDVFKVPDKVNYHDLLKTCPISCLTAIYDSERLGKLYMPIIELRQDYGLWLKILKKVDFAYGLDFAHAIYRIRKNSISRNKIKALLFQWKIYREAENFSFFKSIYYTLFYIINGIKKYFKVFFS